ncbi:conserved membrane protein of unknown function [Candidatus Promineifilum breve]|uniref:HdeD family acid-resistance protein n=1 Tax=Candidatus Promineifilum breve TaxID=1806508 RepID=A0A160T3T1_9CHLR|nr:DUF308 domain-containing protein [Candidatus Promineifilum breve]CUS03688.2 conserved membrane protein of unknown function [Candidatus Promineifilum breve]
MTTAKAAFGQQKRAVPWWIPLIEGIALIIIGILLFSNPAATIVVLAQVLAIYWLISGIMEIVSLFLDRTAWGLKLLGGIIGIWAGLFIINNPLSGTLALGLTVVIILGIQSLILGVIHLLQAFRGAGWGMGVVGIINIIFGLILLGNTLIAAATLPWVLGAFALIGGIATVFMAFRLRTT